ncbi:M6 family metalloprotease domain-containing protein [Sulfurimonas aquatica]|nr:M6 family metalloprotease domain-containing protein [Sulfurimonas aquatica]
MIKTILLLLSLLFFIGCGGVSSSENVDTNVTTTQEQTTDTTLGAPSNAVAKSSIPMLAVLVSYNNQSISSSEQVWSDKLFGKSPHQLNHYYLEVSNNNFEFSKVVESSGIINNGVASVKLNINHPNLITDNSDYFADTVYSGLSDALKKLDSNIDFSNYDKDANGHITRDELNLIFIIAGFEDAYETIGSDINSIWAHESCIENSNIIPTLDSVSLMGCEEKGNFALFGEKHDILNPHDATIGIIAHELGHSAFNLPDLYNMSNNGATGGIGNFGLMGAGTWGMQNSLDKPGNTPTHFCAWSKYYNNWVTPKSVKGSTTLTQTSSVDYDLIKIPLTTTSYYLLENRNNSGYDKGLYSLDGIFNGGMALWKIDETKLTQTHFDDNSVNASTTNKGVDLVEAQPGLIDFRRNGGDEDALFYQGNVSSFGGLFSNVSSRGSIMSLNIN